MTSKYIFDYHDGDIWWCTADIGWVTGHIVHRLRPAVCRGEQRHVRGYPDLSGCGTLLGRVIDKYKVTQFYTAPTAIRRPRHGEGDQRHQADLSSLKLLGSVGEPINPEVWLWYWRHVGKERCPVVDTWWQTETGAEF